MSHNRSKYEPTPEEIEKAKAEIRKEWETKKHNNSYSGNFEPRVLKLNLPRKGRRH